ncbi:MAG: LysR family transcriptional regulator [Candidatus Marinimicrobia bacterium]|jgi:DNA-binding transcriptional LysR family regulator|nr:LysR family transcriptional regulator [Deltaproteobacteria bacterium]MBT7974039.1 LysR family transcriptional regulator [Candidatus Neomarinimicrobiota bacterium]
MTYDQLKAFVAVAQTGSFRAASEKLFLTQPAISITVKNLEELLGLRLFSREQYRPALTPEGKLFYRNAHRLLNQTETLEKLGKRLALGTEPEIGIALSPLCPLDWLMEQLIIFGNEYPHTQVNLSFEQFGGATKRLLDGSVDFSLTTLSHAQGNFVAVPFRTVTLHPVASPEHPLSHTSRILQDKELRGYVQVMVRGSEILSSKKEDNLAESQRQWFVGDYLMASRIIEAGMGWGLLPDHMAEAKIRAGNLIPIKVASLQPLTVEIKLVRRLDNPLGAITNKLTQILLQSS